MTCHLLHGPVELDHDEIAAVTSRVLGTENRYASTSPERFGHDVEQTCGLHSFPGQDLGEVAKDHWDGAPSGVNDAIERNTSRPSLAMASVFERNRDFLI